ncbi:hypothetical protein L1987_02491 [Smallanthus sonchifolius]|uniref:Uncharacterized protein n=1 Tax=Smallanthus sonchifolius TaxID=185202 RepID=A0ACB9K7X0_9ASTR|nr:hypothetical protein L1987_02491 [Smallanthus sonchifolius]
MLFSLLTWVFFFTCAWVFFLPLVRIVGFLPPLVRFCTPFVIRFEFFLLLLIVIEINFCELAIEPVQPSLVGHTFLQYWTCLRFRLSPTIADDTGTANKPFITDSGCTLSQEQFFTPSAKSILNMTQPTPAPETPASDPTERTSTKRSLFGTPAQGISDAKKLRYPDIPTP